MASRISADFVTEPSELVDFDVSRWWRLFLVPKTANPSHSSISRANSFLKSLEFRSRSPFWIRKAVMANSKPIPKSGRAYPIRKEKFTKQKNLQRKWRFIKPPFRVAGSARLTMSDCRSNFRDNLMVKSWSLARKIVLREESIIYKQYR